MKRLTKVFAETTHGTKGYEPVNEIVVNTESICNFSEIVTTLGLLEDVLEEFELTSAEDLRNYLNFKGNMAIWEGKLELKNKIAYLETKLKEAQKPKEIRFNGFVVDCNYDEARKVLQEDILKMWEENKKLKESEELSNYAKCILENKKLEQEIQQLKQQLHELPKKIVSEIKDCLLDFSNGWWRYFMTDGCEYMLSSDLQGCLDETIDTILKKYGGEDE